MADIFSSMKTIEEIAREVLRDEPNFKVTSRTMEGRRVTTQRGVTAVHFEDDVETDAVVSLYVDVYEDRIDIMVNQHHIQRSLSGEKAAHKATTKLLEVADAVALRFQGMLPEHQV